MKGQERESHATRATTAVPGGRGLPVTLTALALAAALATALVISLPGLAAAAVPGDGEGYAAPYDDYETEATDELSQEMYGGGILRLELKELNQALANAGYPPLDGALKAFVNESLTPWSPGSGLYLGAASASAWGSQAAGPGAGAARSSINIEYFGLEAGYGLWIGRRLWLTAGAQLGGGTTTLQLTKGGATTPEQALAKPQGARLNRWFLAVRPAVGASFALTDWLGIRLWANHMVTFWPWGNGWRQEGLPLSGGPGHFRGPSYQQPSLGIGLVFGSVMAP